MKKTAWNKDRFLTISFNQFLKLQGIGFNGVQVNKYINC